jgi:hypothetical protein
MGLAARIALVLCILAANAEPARAAEVAYTGRLVAEVLEEQRSRGLGLVYSDQLVSRDLRVLREPDTRDPLLLVEEILQPHGLALSRKGDNLYAVVRRPAPESAARPSTREQESVSEVVVSSRRYAIATMEPIDRALFTRGQIERMPRLGDEALRAVQRLPGAASNGFSALARIRGGEENESAIVLDGLTLFEPFHLKNFLGPISLLDSRLIGSIEAYTGGYPVEQGDRMSAVIDIHSLPPEEQRRELGFSVFHASGLVSGSFSEGRGGWLTSVRRSNLDLIAQLSESDYGKPAYFDGFGRVTYQLSSATRLSVDLLASHDVITASTSRERSRLDYSNRYVWGTWEHRASNGIQSRLTGSLTHIDNDRGGTVTDPAGVTGNVTDTRSFNIAGIRYEGTATASEAGPLSYRWGAELRLLEASYRYASEVRFGDEYLLPIVSLPAGDRQLARSSDIGPTGESYAAWWSTRVRTPHRLTAELGVRWDAQDYTRRHLDRQLSPRLNLLYEMNDATDLRASWGRYFQAQGIHELQVEDGVSHFLGAQRADHLILSIERQLAPSTRLRLELYQKDYSRPRPRFENLFDPLALMPELRADRVRIAPEASHVRAAEVLISRRNAGPWTGWLSYTLSRAVDRIDGREVLRSWDQRHAIQIGIDRRGAFWDFALTGSWHSGWPATALNIADSNGAITIAPRNSERLTDFSTVDVRVTRRFALRRGELETFGEVSNALNRQNACCRRYEASSLDDGGVELDVRTRSWLPLVPSLGVLWKF